MRCRRRAALGLLTVLAVAGCAAAEYAPPEGAEGAREAAAFVVRVERELRRKLVALARAEWARGTDITPRTASAVAKAAEARMAYTVEAVRAAGRYRGLRLDADTARRLRLLRLSISVPAPAHAGRRGELARLAVRLKGMFNTAEYCRAGGECRDLGRLSTVMAHSRDPADLREAWRGWRAATRDMAPLYRRYVVLANEGARDLGFADLGELWRSRYDMPPDKFEREMERLWAQVAPLYRALHCYVRARLRARYGPAAVPARGPIPAHLLGNMWAQNWLNIYPLVEPYPGEAGIDVSARLVREGYEPVRMVRLGERFFTSLGLPPLPKSFWTRSMFRKPQGRKVACHARTTDVSTRGDVRLRMCIKPTHEDLLTIHHELGHDFYLIAYKDLPLLYQAGAHDGFHEAVGDAMIFSVTPEYLRGVGLLDRVSDNRRATINRQMRLALHRLAFLPFGYLVDRWRWGVFAGRIAPDRYNSAWWALRRRVQGVAPPVPRGAADFDPGAKYHVPAGEPYARYFLAGVLQFQFHRALCRAAGKGGALYRCSIQGSRAAGRKLEAMLRLGASRPWPEALEALTGERRMDAGALLDYFRPLAAWLKKQNRGRACGWDGR